VASCSHYGNGFVLTDAHVFEKHFTFMTDRGELECEVQVIVWCL